MKNPRYEHYEFLECWGCGRAVAFYGEYRKDNEKKKELLGAVTLRCPTCFVKNMTEEELFKYEHMEYKPYKPAEKPVEVIKKKESA